MPEQVTTGALLKCSMGVAPAPLSVLPVARVMAMNMPAGTIMDNIMGANISPFGMCNSTSNPAVIAATAAALGVKTPAPCTPVTPAPWTPGSSKVLIAGKPALNKSCKLTCVLGGSISITSPGCTTVKLG